MKEAKVHFKIYKLHEEDGWRIFENKESHANIQFELNTKITLKNIYARCLVYPTDNGRIITLS